MEGVKGRGRSFKKRQSRRQTAMHNLVRNRWDAVYWNIHYNFSPFSLFLSPNCVSRGETRLPSTLANPTTTGNLWFTISTEHHPRLRFGLRPDISSLEAFFLFLFFFFALLWIVRFLHQRTWWISSWKFRFVSNIFGIL